MLTGGGSFADETNLRGQSYACMVRSPHAHGLIVSIDTGPAEGMPGVIAVLTRSDASGPNLGRRYPFLGLARAGPISLEASAPQATAAAKAAEAAASSSGIGGLFGAIGSIAAGIKNLF